MTFFKRPKNWLGIQDLNYELQISAKTFFSINATRSFAHNLITIILILFLLNNLPYYQVGFIWAIYYLIVSLLGYPAGILADTIGQKIVISFVFCFRIMALFILIFANTLGEYLLFMIAFAISTSTEAGVLESWFDNRYNYFSSAVDNDRSMYTKFQAKTISIINLASILAFILGGIISTIFDRRILFAFSLLCECIVLILIILLMQKSITEYSLVHSPAEFAQQTIRSTKYFLSSKLLLVYFIGTAVLIAANSSIWADFMLFKLYESYTGSDAGAGILRAIVFTTSLVWQILLIKLAKMFHKEYFWVIICTLFGNGIFFTAIMLYYFSFPPQGLNIVLILGFLIIYQMPTFWESLEAILRTRVQLHIVPTFYRNSMYSLLPVLATFFGIPFSLLTGQIISNNGFMGSFIWLIGVCIIGSGILGAGIFWQKEKNSV